MPLNAVTTVQPHDGLYGHVRSYPYGVVPPWVAQWAPCQQSAVFTRPAKGGGPTQGFAYPSQVADIRKHLPA